MKWIHGTLIISAAILSRCQSTGHERGSHFQPSDNESLSEALPFTQSFRRAQRQVTSSEPYPKIALIDSGLDSGMAQKEGLVVSAQLSPMGQAEMLNDSLGHGTGLFLMLKARRNDFGMVGLIPDADITPVALGTKEEFYSAKLPMDRLARVFEAVKREGIKLVSMSLSNTDKRWNKRRMADLLKKYEMDFLLVVASGNDAFELKYGKKCPYVPICNQSPNLLKVGASDYRNSNHGEAIDLWVTSESYQWKRCAPTTVEPNFCLSKSTSTSAAVPKVVAIAALLWKQTPELKPAEIRAILTNEKAMTGREVDPVKTILLNKLRRPASN